MSWGHPRGAAAALTLPQAESTDPEPDREPADGMASIVPRERLGEHRVLLEPPDLHERVARGSPDHGRGCGATDQTCQLRGLVPEPARDARDERPPCSVMYASTVAVHAP